MDGVAPMIRRWLEEDGCRPRKQRHTVRQSGVLDRREHLDLGERLLVTPRRSTVYARMTRVALF
jgi:hypothetical protein